MSERYVIQGYEFSTKQEAEEAKKELAAVQYISKKVEGESLENTFKIYEKLLKENMFHTKIGLDYLRKLKDYLADKEVILDNTVSGIQRRADRLDTELKTEKAINAKRTARLKELLITSAILNLVLIIVVVVMIIIASTGNNTTILNYEENLQNRYSSWEKELQSKEAVLRELEQSLAALEK